MLPTELALKRAFDVSVAAGLLVATAPLVAAIALAVRLDSRGPAFFTQTRVGRGGRPFTIYKFRTMVVDDARPDQALGAGDAGITRVGRVLRKTSLDELPQLLNILKGDMSVVGPRPTLPGQVARHTPEQRRRLLVKPGVTGWAQVNGRNRLPWPERIALDLWYVDHASLGLDARILARTLRVVATADGVYAEPDPARVR